MAISANQIVQVLPRILTGTGKDLQFNGLVLDKSNLIPVDDVLSFGESESVGDYFGTLSDEYKFAQIYFGGYTNSQIKPSILNFYRNVKEGANAFVRGVELAPVKALSELKAISSGSFNVSFDGSAVELAEVDLSSANSLSDVASIIELKLQDKVSGVSCTFSSHNNCFTVQGVSKLDSSSVADISGDIAIAMGLTDTNAVVSVGSAVKSVNDIMNSLTSKYQNFVTFTTLDEASDEDALELAKWSSAQSNAGTMYLYVCWDSDEGNLNINNTNVIAEQLKAENVGATCVVYNSYAYAAFIMGTGASINWEANQGTITWAFKSLEGLGANINDNQQSLALQHHGVNFMGNFATRNDNFVFLYNGSMLGAWSWIDTYLNACWLCNAFQVQIMAGFKAVRRAPYNEIGYALVRSWCKDVINRAVNNGVIDTGVTLSETQKSTLIQELGGDYSNDIFSNGYYLQIKDGSVNARQQRETPVCNFVYTYGGAIHKLTMPAIAVV